MSRGNMPHFQAYLLSLEYLQLFCAPALKGLELPSFLSNTVSIFGRIFLYCECES